MTLREFVRLRRARLRGWIGLFRLLLAAARGQVDEVWIGDSHSVTFTTGRPPVPGIFPTTEGRWAWHLGPRVMYSIARDGLPPVMLNAARVIGRIPGSRRTTWLFSFGEIDIRCHLAPRLVQAPSPEAATGFVATYVDRVRAMVDLLGTARGTIVVPVPPSLDSYDHAAFPVAGSPEERVAAHRAVRSALATAVAASTARPALRLLDPTDALSGPDGLMPEDFSDDGCHTNDAGRAVVRREVATQLA